MDLQPLHLINDWVVLRPLQPIDLEPLFSVASDPLIWEQHPNPDRYRRDVFETYFKGALASGGAFLIRDVRGEVVGCSRFYEFDSDLREVKIGYTFFARQCWGQPYNRSTKRLMLDHAFLYVDQVLFHVGANNIRSQKAMDKLGAELTGQEDVAYYGEQPRTNFVYRIRKSDWITPV